MAVVIEQLNSRKDIYAELVKFETHLVPTLSARGIDLAHISNKLAVRGKVFLLMYQGKRAGLLAGYMNDEITKIAYISIIAIDKNHRGLKLGKQLLLHAENEAMSHGMKIMKLEVRHDNSNAIAFYKHMGYTIIGNASSVSFHMQKILSL